MPTINLGYGENFQHSPNYPAQDAATGTAIVGRYQTFYRIQRYTFTNGSKQALKCSLNWPSGVFTLISGGFALKWCWSTDANLWQSLTADSDSWGTVSWSDPTWPGQGTPYITEHDINFAPYSTYYLYIWTNSATDNARRSFSGAPDLAYTEPPTSAVGAPTAHNMDPTPSVVPPGGTITIALSGATDGVQNSVVGYDIYYKMGSGVSTSSWHGYAYKEAGTGYQTQTFTIPADSPRGEQFYYMIRTRGSAGDGWYSGWVYGHGGGKKVNQLPAAPTVTQDKEIVPSTGGTVKFTGTGGSDPNGTTTSVRYSTSASGTKEPLPSSINVESATTFYFWSWDGLEYSANYITKSVAINSKPTFTFTNIPTKFKVGGSDGASGDCVGFVSAHTLNVTPSKAGTISVLVTAVKSSTLTSFDDTPDDLFSVSATRSASAEATTWEFDVGSLIKDKTSLLQDYNILYKMSVTFNDGIEDSDTKEILGASKFCAFPKSPTVTATWNQLANANIANTKADFIWRKARLKVPTYELCGVHSVKVTNGGVQQSATLTTATSGNDTIFDVTIAGDLPGNTQTTIELTSANTNGMKVVATKTVTQVPDPTLTNFVYGAFTIKPFTSTGTFNVSCAWPFGSAESLAAAYTDYALSGADAIKILHSRDANTATKNIGDLSKSADTLTGILDRATIYGFANELGIQVYTRLVKYNTQVQITNLYGRTYKSAPVEATYDFNESAVSPKINTLKWSTDGNTWTDFALATNKLQEGLHLRFVIGFGLYSGGPLTLHLKARQTGATEWIPYHTHEYAATELNRATGRTAATNNITVDLPAFAEIRHTESLEWGVFINSDVGPLTTTEVLRHILADIELQSCTFDGTNFEYVYVVNDIGATAPTADHRFYDGTGEVSGSLSAAMGATPATSTGWDVKPITVKTTTTVTGLTTNTKTSYSNYKMVYGATPTVAYRKNHLGINTKTPSNEAILDIHATSGRDKIILTGKTMVGGLPQTTTITVNFSTREVSGAIVDGGEW